MDLRFVHCPYSFGGFATVCVPLVPQILTMEQLPRNVLAPPPMVPMLAPIPLTTLTTEQDITPPLTREFQPTSDLQGSEGISKIAVDTGESDEATPLPMNASDSPLPCKPQCSHRQAWSRLRGKRGNGYYVCHHCGVKWKMVRRPQRD